MKFDEINTILEKMKEEYRIYAPKRLKNRGKTPGTDLIRYGEISSIEEVVYDVQSDFSSKEVFYPISQTMFYFSEDECRESEMDHSKKY
jgi:anaerobic sulfite reductase subunit A